MIHEAANEEDVKEDVHKNKSDHRHFQQKPLREGEREFERHSGTGRGYQ